MFIKVSFQHIESSDSLREFTEEKSKKIKKFFKGKINLDWHLSQEHERKIAHCHLTGKNIDFFAEDSTKDFQQSIDSVVTKLERQIRKQKEKVKDNLHA